MQPTCVWAIHCFSHIVEETKDPKEGIDFLEKTRKNWEESSLDNHITWHLGLHYLGEAVTPNITITTSATVMLPSPFPLILTTNSN